MVASGDLPYSGHGQLDMRRDEPQALVLQDVEKGLIPPARPQRARTRFVLARSEPATYLLQYVSALPSLRSCWAGFLNILWSYSRHRIAITAWCGLARRGLNDDES